jgi:hypothetical protein
MRKAILRSLNQIKHRWTFLRHLTTIVMTSTPKIDGALYLSYYQDDCHLPHRTGDATGKRFYGKTGSREVDICILGHDLSGYFMYKGSIKVLSSFN